MARSRRGINVLGVVRWLFLAFMLAFTALPMLWMFSTSIKTEFASIQQPPRWIPGEPTFQQYTTLLSPANATGQHNNKNDISLETEAQRLRSTEVAR